MAIAIQFLYRLSLGLAAAMSLLPARWVDSGYFRVHLYVLLGLNALGTAMAMSSAGAIPIWPAAGAAAVSYFGAVCWLYEKHLAGRISLVVVTLLSLCGSWVSALVPAESDASTQPLRLLDPATSGLLLGAAMAAMLLGHWYLNNPGMRLEPLRRLIVWMAIAIAVRSIVAGIGLWQFVTSGGWPEGVSAALLAMHWLAGIGGTAVVAVMAWQTLKIPNTQSATGLLYVAVIATFLGELASQLLSAETPFPL